MPHPLGRIAAVLSLLAAAAVPLSRPAVAATTLWFDDLPSASVSVSGQQFVDGHGREVVLRGFNVSGEAKLAEHGTLPFASTADAVVSATAMRALTGANTVRLLLSWAAVQPAPDRIDTGYLSQVSAQLAAFADRGFTVFLDYHQDLYSRYLFNSGSWYTGDGAPQWVVAQGGYPTENCGLCVQWGQNITQNAAVQDATYDFWHNRLGVQDAFLYQAQQALTYLRQHLTAAQFARVVGFDPFNEPYAGKYDSGQDSQSWERDLLWPFYLKFRARMDAAGWTGKPAFVEPNLFWNANLSFVKQAGGLADVGAPGTGFVFNTHFYDQAALSGVFMWGNASDGQYATDFRTVRDRAAALGTAAMVSEFGSPVTGYTSDKSPTVLKAMYQALDSRLSGADWWSQAVSSGTVLSGTQWHWDVYSGRHHELMNGNPDKVLTGGDAWNGEDFSVVRTGDSGAALLRADTGLLDRAYPLAVAGHTLAFTYEDRTTGTWNPVPGALPTVRTLVGTGRYAVLVWRASGTDLPTEVHLPAGFTAAGTTVVSDLGALTGLPSYTAQGHVAGSPVAVAAQAGGAGGTRLVLSTAGAAGTVHYALVTSGAAAGTAAQRAAARQELAAWVAARGFG
jgi:hypothetical protein